MWHLSIYSHPHCLQKALVESLPLRLIHTSVLGEEEGGTRGSFSLWHHVFSEPLILQGAGCCMEKKDLWSSEFLNCYTKLNRFVTLKHCFSSASTFSKHTLGGADLGYFLKERGSKRQS